MVPRYEGGTEVVVMGCRGLKDVRRYISGWFRNEEASHVLLDLSGADLCLRALSTEKTCATRDVSTRK
jgi:hypothetical protein